MGYMGADNEGIWAGMVGGDGEGEEAVKEESPPHDKAQPPPPEPPATISFKSSRWHFESDESSDGSIPPKTRNPPPGHKGHPRRRGGGGGGADDALVGTKVHVPYPGVEVGTVTGVHRRKAGVVGVEYLDDPQLYEVPRGHLFPDPQGAQERLDRVRQGKGKATHPPLQASLTRRLTA